MSSIDATICILSLPDRHDLLVEALESVRSQTVEVAAVLVGIDNYAVGEAENMNRLIRCASTEWIFCLHGDDLYRETHCEEMMKHTENADVVVGCFDLEGRPEASIEPHHCNPNDFRFTNWAPPSAVALRRDFILDVGGFIEGKPEPFQYCDYLTWNRLLDAGAKFACSHERTMIYRFGSWNANRSWNG